MDRILVVDKPKGLTSHDVVKIYRKKLGIKKIGHAGTLDPFATGVLILLVGAATKKFDQFKTLDKVYELIIELGKQTDTGDPEGKTIAKEKIIKPPLITKIKTVLESFVGTLSQRIPIYSAAKFKGKPLYYYARRGQKVAEKRKKVTIKKIKLLEYKKNKHPRIIIQVVCSSGTYMRQLAVDIGKKLNLPAVAVNLKRTKIGNYSLADSKKTFVK